MSTSGSSGSCTSIGRSKTPPGWPGWGVVQGPSMAVGSAWMPRGVRDLWGVGRRQRALKERRNRESKGGPRLPGLFRQEKGNRDGARREPRVAGTHLLGKEGFLTSLELCVHEELCPNTQGHIQSCPTWGRGLMGGKCLEMPTKQGSVRKRKTPDGGLREEQTRSPMQEGWRGFDSLGAGIKDFPYPRCAGFLHSPAALHGFNPFLFSCSAKPQLFPGCPGGSPDPHPPGQISRPQQCCVPLGKGSLHLCPGLGPIDPIPLKGKQNRAGHDGAFLHQGLLEGQNHGGICETGAT